MAKGGNPKVCPKAGPKSGPKGKQPAQQSRGPAAKKRGKPEKGKSQVPKNARSRTTLDFDVEPGSELSEDYFVPIIPINVLMGLVFGLLIMCALDPEDCALIPGYRENAVRQGWIASCILAFLLFLNLIMTMQVIKLCERNQLNTSATRKWIAQTLISGVLSWKVLREADDVLRETELMNLGKGGPNAASDNLLLGPFFLNCNKKQLAGFIKHNKH